MPRSLLVFLCHASEDKPAVQALHDRLVADGFDVWLDQEDLLPGQNWNSEIRKAVRAADAVIICLSKKSIAKEGYVQKEIQTALDAAQEKPEGAIYIIPARLEPCTPPNSLSEFERVDLFFSDGQFDGAEYDRLLRSLNIRSKRLASAVHGSQITDGDQLIAYAGHLREIGDLEKALKLYDQVRKLGYSHPELESIIRSVKREIEANQRESNRLQKYGIYATVIVGIITALATIAAALLTGYFEHSGQATATAMASTTVSPTSIPFQNSPEPADSPVPPDTSVPSLQSEIVDVKGVQMILISSGTFTMGTSNISPKDIQNVKPSHKVSLSHYYLDEFEVTNGAYALCEKAGVCKSPHNLSSFARPQGYYSDPGYANYPVIYVDWNMAKTYCEWRGARLPTEAEWEKAARGTSDKYFPWGGNKIDCKYARYGACGRDTSEVGIHPDGVSPYGVHDLAGNVWEWLSDFYGVDYYSLSPSNNPQGPATSEYHVARGGAWNSESEQLHVTFRNRFRPSYSYYNLGFRCAKNP